MCRDPTLHIAMTEWYIAMTPYYIAREGVLLGVLYSWVLYSWVLCSTCFNYVLYSMQKLLYSKGCYIRGARVIYSTKCFISCYMQMQYNTSACYIALNLARVL